MAHKPPNKALFSCGGGIWGVPLDFHEFSPSKPMTRTRLQSPLFQGTTLVWGLSCLKGF